MLDEPILCPKTDDANPVSNQNPSIREDIHGLLRQEPFGVLCTQGEGQPYGSVVAYAFTQDLSALFFATSTATRKYCLLSACNQVAMVVDNRDRFPNDLMSTSAVTITGRANQVKVGPDFERWAHLLTERHPYLESFIESPPLPFSGSKLSATYT